jgi:4'-phosphopantetheinyl transferase EntD
MGLISNKEIMEDCFLGSWEITEDYDTLYSMVSLGKDETERLEGFLNPSRKLEFLSVRVLLQIILNKDARIVYDPNRKPLIKGGSWQISISHSYNMTSVLLSKNKKVGIDLEYMSHRIGKIAHKFIRSDEKITDDPEIKRYHMYIHWCAKEALYKICDKNMLNFKKNLFIKPFEPKDQGVIKGYVHSDKKNEEFDMLYYKIDNYIVVLCCKKMEP